MPAERLLQPAFASRSGLAEAVTLQGGAMQVDLNRVIEQVSKEKGIDKSIVINAVEEMMHSAARRTFGAERNIESRYNNELRDRAVRDQNRRRERDQSLGGGDA